MQDNRSAENAVYEATDAELVTGTWYNPTEAGALVRFLIWIDVHIHINFYSRKREKKYNCPTYMMPI